MSPRTRDGGAHHREDRLEDAVEQEEDERFLVHHADAIVGERAVVVHPHNTPLALGAVIGALRLKLIALRAITLHVLDPARGRATGDGARVGEHDLEQRPHRQGRDDEEHDRARGRPHVGDEAKVNHATVRVQRQHPRADGVRERLEVSGRVEPQDMVLSRVTAAAPPHHFGVRGPISPARQEERRPVITLRQFR